MRVENEMKGSSTNQLQTGIYKHTAAQRTLNVLRPMRLWIENKQYAHRLVFSLLCGSASIVFHRSFHSVVSFRLVVSIAPMYSWSCLKIHLLCCLRKNEGWTKLRLGSLHVLEFNQMESPEIDCESERENEVTVRFFSSLFASLSVLICINIFYKWNETKSSGWKESSRKSIIHTRLGC